MPAVSEILLAIRGSNEGAIRAIDGTMVKMGELRAEGQKTSATLAGIGAKAALGLGVTFLAAAGESIKMASEFQKNMTMVRTQAHDTTDNLDQMGQAVLAMASEVGTSAEKLALGLYHVTSVGYTGATALEVLRQAAIGAKIGNADLDTTTYALTSVMQTYNLKAGDAAKTMATLNAIIGAGDMRMQDLVSAISTQFLGAAETFGVSIQSAGAALAFLTDRGASAAESGTRLRMSMALMAAPASHAAKLLSAIGLSGDEVKTRTDAMTNALKDAGLTTVKLADDMRQPDGIMVALKDLKTHLEASGLSADYQAALIAKAFGGGRSGAAIMTMYQQIDVLGSKFDLIGKGTKRYDADWADTQKNFSFQMDKMKAALGSLAIKFGTALLPLAGQFVGWISTNLFPVLSRLADWFVHSGIPLLHEFANYLNTSVLPVLRTIAEIVLPPVIAALQFFADHTTLVKIALDALILRWTVLKGLGIATSVLSFAAAFRTMAGIEGIGAAISATLGLEATIGTGLLPTIAKAKAAIAGLFVAGEAAPAVAGVTQLSLGIGGAAAGAGGAAAGVGAGAALAMGGLIVATIAAVGFAVVEMYQHWDEFKTYISSSFMDAMRAVGGWFREFGTYIGGSFMDAVRAVGSWFSDLGGYLSGSFMAAAHSVGDWFSAFGSYISSSFMDALHAVERFASAIPGAVSHAIAVLIYRELPQIPYQIGYVLGLALGLVMKFGSALVAWASVEPGKWIWRFIHWTGTIQTALSYIFTDALGRFARWGVDMVARAGKAGSDVVSAIGNWFRQLPGTVWQGLVDAYTHMLAWGQMAKDWAWNTGSAVVGAIGQWFHDLPGTIWADLLRIASDIGNWGSQLAKGGGDAGSSFVTSVWNWVKDLPGKFLQLGKDVVTGLLNGIESMSGQMLSTIGGFLSGLLNGANKALGIGSPSRVFAQQIGKPIAQGIALGITDNTSVVQSALGRILTVVPGGGTTAGSTVAAGHSGSGIGTVNVYNPTSNVDVVTAIDQQRWLERMSRRGIGAPPSWPLTMAGA
jgi:TP901 family phage tail tape measure protein